MTSPVETLKGGALNAAISNAVVRLLSEYVGKGPTKARSIHSGKIVLCVLEDTMTKAERSLTADGKEDWVLKMRHAFQLTMRKDLTAAVEALTERKVVAFMSANHVEPDLAAEIFVLDEPVAGTGDGLTSRRDGRQAQSTQDAERWPDGNGSVDGDGRVSSGAVARAEPPGS
jgi:uncharacterized protein YbcI